MTPPGRLSGLARVTARGFAVTFAFDVLLQVVVLVQSLLVPRLLGPEAVGVYALALALVSVGSSFKELGTHEKLVQERDIELPRAYAVAFTLEVAVSSALFVVVLAIAPLVARYYDRGELVWVAAALGVTIFTSAFLNLPGALHLRQLRYGRQNLLAALRPLVGFVVTVPLAFAGAGVWSLVGGAVASFVVSAAVVTWGVPFRPRLLLDRALLRRYVAYGWPLWLANLLSLSTTWAGTFAISAAAGVAALGYFSVAQSLAQRAFRLDAVLAKAVFPALCKAQDDLAGQRRAFVAVNRLTVMWAGPIGFGLFIFAGDLVRLVLGQRWEPAVFLFRMQGLAVVTGSIGFSWDAFFRARGETRPTLTFSIISEAWVFVVLLPAVIVWEVTGAAWAIASLGVLSVIVRQAMVRRMFRGINLLHNARWELAATAVAAAATAVVRDAVGPPQSLLELAALVATLLVVTGGLLLVVDRRFLADLVRRLRRSGGGGWPATTPSSSAPGPVEIAATAAGAWEAPRLAGSQVVALPPPLGLRATFAAPGAYPLGLAAAGPQTVWVTLRDASAVCLLDLEDGRWQTWRVPTYPHLPCVDEQGRVWAGLTLASGAVVVDAEEGVVRRIKLPRTRELLGSAWAGDACWLVDAGRRALHRIDGGGRATTIELPPGVGRPMAVAVDDDGGAWVTDTARPGVVIVGPGDETAVVPVPAPTRGVIADPDRGCVWAGHAGLAAASRIGAGARDVETFDLPGMPYGLALGRDGALLAALLDEDAVVELRPDGSTRAAATGDGSGPISMAWVGDDLCVACSGDASIAVLR